MFKFLVLGVILALTVVKHCCGQTPSNDSQPYIVTQRISPPENDSSDNALRLQKAGQYHIYASRLNLYLGDSFDENLDALRLQKAGQYASRLNLHLGDSFDKKLDADYVVTEGIGAYKLHSRKLSWGKARRTCVEEGGHLAVIRTELEETILLRMMVMKSIDLAWVGYHDIFEEGDWFSVLDEPIAKTGWARWSTELATNPIPAGGHCGELKVQGGLVNQKCTEKRSFICKVSIN